MTTQEAITRYPETATQTAQRSHLRVFDKARSGHEHVRGAASAEQAARRARGAPVAVEVKRVHRCDIPKCPRTSENDRIRTFRLDVVTPGLGRGRLPEVDLCDEHSACMDLALKVARREKRTVRRATAAMDEALQHGA